MKRYLLLFMLSAFVLVACDKQDDYAIREWTVASQLGIAHGATTLQPVLLVKTSDDASWRAIYNGIEGFSYEPGYEYQLRIEAAQVDNPPQDGSSVRYSLLEQRSKIPAQSIIPESYYPIFTMEVGPESVNYQGLHFLNVRFPESGINQWQPWPFFVDGFDAEPGYNYLLRVGTSVVEAPDSGPGYYTVKYSLLEMLDKQPAHE